MPVAKKVLQHLHEAGVAYEILVHPHTGSSQQTAEASHVSGERLAKGVVLRREDGRHLLAVVPASRLVHYPDVEARLSSRVQPASAEALAALFPDCEPGAVPPFGALYGLRTLVDEALLSGGPAFFEAGDHQQVVCVNANDFRRLLAGADFFPFSIRPEQDAP